MFNVILPTGIWWILTSKSSCILSNDPMITSLIPKWRSMPLLNFDTMLIKIGWLHLSRHQQMHRNPWVPNGPYGQMLEQTNFKTLIYLLFLIFLTRLDLYWREFNHNWSITLSGWLVLQVLYPEFSHFIKISNYLTSSFERS